MTRDLVALDWDDHYFHAQLKQNLWYFDPLYIDPWANISYDILTRGKDTVTPG